ncbi:hypothetical protein EZJ58_2172 [Sodalis ligni]|uniref:Uncharacterized protein n=1 Tax=Sodalis ligni TaxID=2697027 RepID=A0A4R1NIQ5_9GAMM|nr:hypothetical protein EZJ58_2172 [Sodalis ligni]
MPIMPRPQRLTLLVQQQNAGAGRNVVSTDELAIQCADELNVSVQEFEVFLACFKLSEFSAHSVVFVAMGV